MTKAAAHQRLRRVDRLRSSKDYRRVNRTGSRSAGRHFVAQRAPGRDTTRPCLGLVVSKRVGNAVARNRVKRRVREWFRTHRDALSQAGEDFVVIARSGSADLSQKAIAAELSALVAK